MKSRLNLTVESDIVEKAKEKHLNLSEITEKAIREELNIEKLEVDTTIDKCEFCGRPEEKASKQNYFKGLTWIWPDERWICSSCLKSEGMRVPASKS